MSNHIVEISSLAANQMGVVSHRDFWTGKDGKIENEGMLEGCNPRYVTRGLIATVSDEQCKSGKFGKHFVGNQSDGTPLISGFLVD